MLQLSNKGLLLDLHKNHCFHLNRYVSIQLGSLKFKDYIQSVVLNKKQAFSDLSQFLIKWGILKSGYVFLISGALLYCGRTKKSIHF